MTSIAFRPGRVLAAEMASRGTSGDAARVDLARYYELLRAGFAALPFTPAELEAMGIALVASSWPSRHEPADTLFEAVVEELGSAVENGRNRLMALDPLSRLALLDALEVWSSERANARTEYRPRRRDGGASEATPEIASIDAAAAEA